MHFKEGNIHIHREKWKIEWNAARDNIQTIHIIFLDKVSDFLNGWSVIDLIFQNFRKEFDSMLYIIEKSKDKTFLVVKKQLKK